jgi:hypothetical protein
LPASHLANWQPVVHSAKIAHSGASW